MSEPLSTPELQKIQEDIAMPIAQGCYERSLESVYASVLEAVQESFGVCQRLVKEEKLIPVVLAVLLLAGCSYPTPAPMESKVAPPLTMASAQRVLTAAAQPTSTNVTILASTSLNNPHWVSVTLTNYPVDIYQHVAFNPNGMAGYLMRVDGTQVFDVGTNTSPVLNGLTPGQHTYQVASYNSSAVSSIYSDPVTGTAIAKYDASQAVFFKIWDNKVLKLTVQ